MPGENVSRKFLVFPSGKDEFTVLGMFVENFILGNVKLCSINSGSHDIPHSGASISNQWQFIVIKPMGSTHRIYTLLPK